MHDINVAYLGTLFGGALDTSQSIWGAPQGPGGLKGASNRGDFCILAHLTPGNGLKVVVTKSKQIEKVLRSILVASLGRSDFLFWLQTVSTLPCSGPPDCQPKGLHVKNRALFSHFTCHFNISFGLDPFPSMVLA